MKKHKILTILSLFTLVMLGVTTIIKSSVKVSAYIEPDAHIVSSNYVRILVVPDPDDYWNASSAITGIVVHQSSSAVTVENGVSIQFSASGSRHLIDHDLQYRADLGTLEGKKFWYFNVRYELIDGKDFQVVRIDPDTVASGSYKIWNATKRYTFSDENITKVWKLNAPSSSKSDLNFSNATGNGISDLMVSYVLEGYMTCSSSALNGYMAYPSLNKTYLLDGRTSSTITLRDFPEEDYVGDITYEEGRPNNSGDPVTTVGEKVIMMKALYEAAQATLDSVITTSNYLSVIATISLIGLTSLFGIYLLRRKPKNI